MPAIPSANLPALGGLANRPPPNMQYTPLPFSIAQARGAAARPPMLANPFLAGLQDRVRGRLPALPPGYTPTVRQGNLSTLLARLGELARGYHAPAAVNPYAPAAPTAAYSPHSGAATGLGAGAPPPAPGGMGVSYNPDSGYWESLVPQGAGYGLAYFDWITGTWRPR